MKTNQISMLLVLLFIAVRADAQELIDLSTTHQIKNHSYPEKDAPENVVVLNVKKINTKEIKLSTYKNLQELRIEYSKFKSVVIDFDVHPLLQSIFINGSEFDTIIFKGKPAHLTRLYLYEKHLNNFNFLSQLHTLTDFNTSDSNTIQIDNLVENLLKLPNLTSLYISDGNIVKLPASFKQFKKLEWLSFTYMNANFDLKSLFETIQNIEIENFDLMNYSAKIMPAEIRLLKKIKSLHIVGCSFTSLPEEIGELTQLIEISASMSDLDSIPNSFIKLVNLQTLGLMPCQFKTIPTVLYKMVWLKKLEVGSEDWFPSNEELKPLRNALKGCEVNDF